MHAADPATLMLWVNPVPARSGFSSPSQRPQQCAGLIKPLKLAVVENLVREGVPGVDCRLGGIVAAKAAIAIDTRQG
jgi:hypothetical protein